MWLVYAVLGVLLAGYLVSLVVRPAGAYSTAIDGWGVDAFELVAGVLCIAGGSRRRPRSVVSVVLGAAIICWSLGDTVFTIESLGGATAPSPSLADAFYLSFFPLSYIAVFVMVRGETRRLSSPNWLDGAVAGLGAGAVCAAFGFSMVLRTTHESVLGTAVNLAYPIGDVLLLLLVIGGTAAMSGRRKTPWLLIAAGFTVNVGGDTVNLLQASVGATHVGAIVNAIAWPTSSLLMSLAMWVSPGRPDPRADLRPPDFVLPGLASAAGLTVLFVGTLEPVNGVATALATATLVLVVMRTWRSVRQLQTQARLRHRQAITDHLTGLANRRRLFQALDALFEHATADRPPMALLFIDLNGFKRINDAFGHPVGDEILEQVGARFTRALRHDDLLARVGGDEFAAVLVDADAPEALAAADRLSASLTEPFQLSAVTATIGASIGIAVAPEDAADRDELLSSADAAMYRAKRAGAAFARYDHRLDRDGDKLALADDLRAAIATGQLVLHYQPQLELTSGRVTAVEALVRWDHPAHGLIAPGRFLPLAQEAGLMDRLTRWVLAEALAQCARWRAGGQDVRVSVNVAAGDLADPELPPAIAGLLAGAGLDPQALVLEITETSIIEDFPRAQHAVARLADLGVAVSVDDFGSGFTSLAYLSDLRVTELKLDRRFISPLTGGERTREAELVRAVGELGHALGLLVVAEGIEDPTALALLRELGCDVAQGYAIGRPVPAGELDLGGPVVICQPRPRIAAGPAPAL
ncbi:MAG TPA: EAL domain-containing protein [Solirubrobacteraceae bacterium]|nr:EAL domain-containing protein [Solirubrobacteraceae bacterium]